MTTLTVDQILALAPDASSAKSGKELSSRSKWVSVARADHVLWGLCQGSGSTPYQTQIDLTEPAFKCSCPSRKFPCKHGLGLYLLFENKPAEFSTNAPPEWVSKWLESRTGRAEQKAQKTGQAEQAAQKMAAAEPAAVAAQQAKTAAKREAKVKAGVADLERWLSDLMRRGLADAPAQPYAFWDAPAARLVDAQAPGLARLVREMAGIPASGNGWEERLLSRLGKLHLILEGYKRIDLLPAGTRADLRNLIGWTVTQDEVLSGEGVADEWLVLGQRVEDEERLKVQRVWLGGVRSGQSALALFFAHGNQPLDTSLVTGTRFEGEVSYFPGGFPQRALVKSRQPVPVPINALPSVMSISDALADHAAAMTKNPWLERSVLRLAETILLRHESQWIVRDGAGDSLRVSARFERGWELMAISGGHPITLFGEWNGVSFLPISVWTDGRLIAF